MTYRIKNWDKLYENNRTRELKNLAWVPFPNSHDGDGFTQLISERDGTALFGAWVLIVQVASKCDPRGTLLRSNGAPHDSASLARMTRGTEKHIRQALITCEEVGWIEEIGSESTIPHDDATIPHDNGNVVPRKKEQNRTEQKESINDFFESARKRFPGTKKGYQFEFDLFKKKHKDWKDCLSLLLPAIEKEITHKHFLNQKGSFCPEWPHFSTWINQRRWEQEFEQIKKDVFDV